MLTALGMHGSFDLAATNCAAEILRMGVVEQDRRDVVRDRRPFRAELDEIARMGGPDPGLDRLRLAIRRGGSSVALSPEAPVARIRANSPSSSPR